MSAHIAEVLMVVHLQPRHAHLKQLSGAAGSPSQTGVTSHIDRNATADIREHDA